MLVAAFVTALGWSIVQRREGATPAASTALTGYIALDVEPFFKDERVVNILAEQRLAVKVTRIGSRDMAARVAAGIDFFMPSGVVAANQISDAARHAGIVATQSSPFHTPMVIASWSPIARILVANGIAQPSGERVYTVDMGKLAETMLAGKRWKDLRTARDYDVSRSVLVSTTDLRRSNSAALYLALVSQAVHGTLATDRAEARAQAARVAPLFTRQGYQESYVNGNFDDYLSIGIGKTPLAFIYENQIVHYALAKSAVRDDMVLLYPRPTIVNKVVLVATSERAKALAELLSGDARLQRIGVEYGFRVADASAFTASVKSSGLAIEERLTHVVDPPAFEIMSEMIEAVAAEMSR